MMRLNSSLVGVDSSELNASIVESCRLVLTGPDGPDAVDGPAIDGEADGEADGVADGMAVGDGGASGGEVGCTSGGAVVAELEAG